MLKFGISRVLATSVLAILSIGATQATFAQNASGDVAVVQVPKQPDDRVTQAASYHLVSPWVLRAITCRKDSESARC